MNLNETFKVSRSKDMKGNVIAFLDPNAEENKETFKYKDIIKDSGANWSLSPKYKYIFPQHKNGFWFWFIGKTEDQWRNVFDKMIKPALEKIHNLEGMGEDDSKESIMGSLDAVIEKIKSSEPTFETDVVLSKDDKEQILNKLESFKLKLTNIKDDETFKETMRKILEVKAAQGHEFSLGNTFLIIIQMPSATIVKSKTNWLKYNRTINKNARPIWLWQPAKNSMVPLSKEDREMIIKSFLKSVGKMSTSELTPQEQERLAIKTSGKFLGGRFDLYDAYDVSDTTLIEGREDLIKSSEIDHEIKWYDDQKDERVKPIYDSLIDFATSLGIQVTKSKNIGGARGVSKSGSIEVLDNEGDDVGLTKTLAHEISHEILHQKYLKNKNPQMKEYFVGTSAGRDLVEQQAELCAWMVLASFGFDLQTTSLNYVAIWGGKPENMIDVFDSVSKTANLLISEVVKRGVSINEENVDIPEGIKQYTPSDVAKILGVEGMYNKVMQNTNQMNEMLDRFYRLANKKII